jgi:hypothetical protein
MRKTRVKALKKHFTEKFGQAPSKFEFRKYKKVYIGLRSMPTSQRPELNLRDKIT